jgi:hypothetical protein
MNHPVSLIRHIRCFCPSGLRSLMLFISTGPVNTSAVLWSVKYVYQELSTRSGPRIANRNNLDCPRPKGISTFSGCKSWLSLFFDGDPSLRHGVLSTIVRSGFQIVATKPSHYRIWHPGQHIFVSLQLHCCSRSVIFRTLMVTSVILRSNLDWAPLPRLYVSLLMLPAVF